jgi:predicted RNase H-like nuclease (RuvC/YqgF family)
MSDVDSDDTVSDEEALAPLSPSKRLSMLDINNMKDDAMSAIEVTRLQEKIVDLEKQVDKWTGERKKLEAELKARQDITPEQNAADREAEEKLRSVMQLIVSLVGKDTMVKLMAEGDDKKIIAAIKRHALRSGRNSSPMRSGLR